MSICRASRPMRMRGSRRSTPLKNTSRRSFRRSRSQPLKSRGRLFLLVFWRIRSQARTLRDWRTNSSRVNARYRNRSAFELVSNRLREPAHRKFARRISALPDRSNNPKHARQIHNLRARLLFQHRQEILHSVNDSPKIDPHHPSQIVERYFFKSPDQRHARIVDEQRHAPMPRRYILREASHAFLAGNIEHVRRNSRLFVRQRGRRLRQSLLINVRNRQRRSSRGELLHQRPPNPAPSARNDSDSLAQERHCSIPVGKISHSPARILRALHLGQQFHEFLLPLALVVPAFRICKLRNVHRAEFRPAHRAELRLFVKIIR